MSNHTPGLWSISNDAVPDGIVQKTIYSDTGSRIATVFQTEDNANLIAAAPDLLEACLAIAAAFDIPVGRCEDLPHAIMVRAAIEKATQ